MYGKGMSYEAIRGHMRDIYGLEISEAKLTAITDQIWEDVLVWQNRALDEIYVIVWLEVLESLRSRGIRDILIACIDHLKGFAETIQIVFPATDTDIQALCGPPGT